MSKWMALLKERKNSVSPVLEPTKPTKGGSVGFVGSSLGEIEKIDAMSVETRQHETHLSDWVDCAESAATMEYDNEMIGTEYEDSAISFAG